jgi:LysR family transcriptional regulator (chromosome initiation inhibitor)
MSVFDRELAATVAAVAEEGAFEAAARRLRLSPSAVSQRVRLMEEQLGRVLIVRSRPVRPTEAGEAVVRLSRQISLLEQDAAAELRVGDTLARLRVSLAADADSLATWLLDPLTRTASAHAFELELLRADPSETARLLESGRVMAVVTSENSPVAGCEISWLGALRYEPVASPVFVSEWLGDTLGGEHLDSAPFVSFDRDDELQTSWLAQRGIEPRLPPRHFVPSAHDLLRSVELGLGWAMVPTAQASAAIATGRVVRLDGPPIRVPLYWQQWSLRSQILDDIRAQVDAAAGKCLDREVGTAAPGQAEKHAAESAGGHSTPGR